MDQKRVERRLAAIFAGDVVGYSRLMGMDEEGTLAALKAHRRAVVNPKIKEHRGRIVKTTGDGILVEFASAVDAVRCAVEIQRLIAERNTEVPQDRQIRFRIGLNVGDIIVDDKDIFGDGVNIAARLEALAEPGGICVSRAVRDQVRHMVDLSLSTQGTVEEHRPTGTNSPYWPEAEIKRTDRATVAAPIASRPTASLIASAVDRGSPFANMSGSDWNIFGRHR